MLYVLRATDGKIHFPLCIGDLKSIKASQQNLIKIGCSYNTDIVIVDEKEYESHKGDILNLSRFLAEQKKV